MKKQTLAENIKKHRKRLIFVKNTFFTHFCDFGKLHILDFSLNYRTSFL